jgi:drug/metabolite transporter (DMT)-like permease
LQVLYQFKVFTTAMFASFLLGTVFSNRKWFSLGLLFIGVVLIQIDTVQDKRGTHKPKIHFPSTHLHLAHTESASDSDVAWYSLDVVAASLAVFLATLTSAFAGIPHPTFLLTNTLLDFGEIHGPGGPLQGAKKNIVSDQ